MKKIIRLLVILILAIVLISGGTVAFLFMRQRNLAKESMAKAYPAPKTMEAGGIRYRDLNRNGRLDIYEDRTKPIDQRVEDLLQQMNLEEKAGSMFISIANIGAHGSLAENLELSNPLSFVVPPNSAQILGKKLTHVNIQMAAASDIARWANALQRLAEKSRLGIPVTISSDPRHAFSFNPLAGFSTDGFSQWPEPIGFGALRDTSLVKVFAQVAAHEYRSVGIHMALHPMADLATEPRWPRINGTFGEDAELAASLVYQYIRGFQGDTLGPKSVACMTKHFSGGGPQKEGLDPHFEFGREQIYPGNNFAYHVIPFRAAIAAGTAAMMPYYGIPMDQTEENVGFAFNKSIITGLLRDSLRFDGVVCSDWSILTDKKILGIKVFGNAGWGLEKLTPQERLLKALQAGIDQFGGEDATELVVQLVKEKKVSEARIDSSVRRILKLKFQLGLFDNPFTANEADGAAIKSAKNAALGRLSQGRAMVLLENRHEILPLRSGLKIYAENLPANIVQKYGIAVSKPDEADIAILRLNAPWRKVGDNLMAGFFHHGDLDFEQDEKERILSVCRKVPTIINIYLDRPAVIPEIAREARAVIADFGAEHDVLMQVLTGRIQPAGRLPFELPASMDAVRKQKEDLPFDSEKPLYSFGYGLSYPAKQNQAGQQ